jgi:hypothetical protein
MFPHIPNNPLIVEFTPGKNAIFHRKIEKKHRRDNDLYQNSIFRSRSAHASLQRISAKPFPRDERSRTDFRSNGLNRAFFEKESAPISA